MPRPINPAEHDLVIKALTSGLSDCVEWKSDALLARVRSDPDLRGLSPRAIRRDIIATGLDRPDEVIQVPEGRDEYRAERECYYKILLD